MFSIHVLFSLSPGENCYFDFLFFNMKARCFVLGVEVGEFGTGLVGRGRAQRLVKILIVSGIRSLMNSDTTGRLCKQKVTLHSVSQKREGS